MTKNIKMFFYAIVVIFGLQEALANENTLENQDIWPMYQGNANHTGYIPIQFNPSTFHNGWSISLISGANQYGLVSNFPITAQGMIFITAGDKNDGNPSLFAVNANTGKIQWKTDLNSIYSISGPSYSNFLLYVEAVNSNPGDANLLAFDITTGKKVYSSHFDAQWDSYLAPTPYSDSVYMNGGKFGGVYGYTSTNGVQQWFNSLNSHASCDKTTPVVNDKYVISYSYNGGISNKLNLVDRETGKLLSQIEIPNNLASFYHANNAPVLDEKNNLAFSIIGGYLTAYDLKTSAVKYSVGFGFADPAQPVLADNTIYSVKNNLLVAVDEMTGNLEWVWYAGDNINLNGSYIIVSSNLIFITSDKGTFAVDRNTHETAWKTPLTGMLTVDQNNLYILTQVGGSVKLYQIRLTQD